MAETALNPLPHRAAALEIIRVMRDAGHTAYLAGGCVRDALLGQTPKDYDVATDATPDRVRRLWPRSNAVGEAFGVVLCYHGHGDQRLTTEVATFRSESTYSDGRRPDAVTFTTADEDAHRRDFTINGLFADPHLDDTTQPDAIIDFVDGQADLQARVIRAIGDPDQRFAEDYLRMLRAVRFAARLNFTLHPDTASAIRQHAPKLDRIARERIGDEVRRTLTGPNSELAVRLLYDLRLFEPIFGQPFVSLQPFFQHLDTEADYATRLALLGRGLDPCLSLDAYRNALCLTNAEDQALRQTVSQFANRDDIAADQPIAMQKRWFAHPRADQVLRHWAALGSSREADDARQRMHALASDGIGLAPTPLLTGDHLVAAGLTPGPAFKPLLEAVYDAQLEGRVTTADQALGLALQHAPQRQPPPDP
ncbi:MAG: CCA tRNA nucleotidyltransferase [Planctomycetota bacterium]